MGAAAVLNARRVGSERMATAESEASLIARARGGEQQAFAEIVGSHSDAVYRTCAGLLGPSEAEDASQEVFVRVHSGLARFRGDSQLRTWIYRIATNVALKRLKRRRRETAQGLPDVATDAPGPDAGLTASERSALLHRALDRLPEHQRAVVVLRGLEGLSFAEVAGVLGIRRPTAESRMARAKVRLREILGPWLDEEGGS